MHLFVRLGQRCRMLLPIVVLLMTFMHPAALTKAQEPRLTPADQPSESPSAQANYGLDAAIDPPMPPTVAVTTEQPAEDRADQTTLEQSVESALPVPRFNSRAIQGSVALSVSVQSTVRASEYLTYSFSYKNTGTTATTSLLLDTVWNNFNYNEGGNPWQFCPVVVSGLSGCGFVTATAFGPAISVVGNVPGGVRYSIASLAPGQSGGFLIRLVVNKNTYPTSLPGGAGIRRPSGSGKLYVNGEATPSAELTVSSLIIGPPLSIRKTIKPNTTLYPLETGTFTITVGNAIGSGDIINGQIRADATPATNVVVKETFPLGSEFVAASGNYTLSGNTLTWSIPTLNPGQSQVFQVVFKKLDLGTANSDCGTLNNASYNIISDELIFNNGAIRYTIGGNAVSYGVITPFIVNSVTMTPSSVVYGKDATISVTVRSFWEQPLTNANLEFKLPGNATYISGTASPSAATQPPAGQVGGTLTWVFDMPATTRRNIAVEKTFTFRVQSGYTNAVNDPGKVRVFPAAGSNVPNACSKTFDFRLNLSARIHISQGSDAPEETKYATNKYYVQRGQDFPYVIYITNGGNEPVVLPRVLLDLPSSVDANFIYVPNSSQVNGVVQAPNTIENGLAGKLEWFNVPVAANGQTIIRFGLTVQGRDYYEYCTRVTTALGEESIIYETPRDICVKINPQIKVTKTANKLEGLPGDEVIFSLSLTNLEAQPYTLGLYDKLDRFEWIEQISGYDTPVYNAGSKEIQWPLVTINPNQTISAVFRARIPGGGAITCDAATYTNEVKFINATDIIRPIPAVTVGVKSICRQIEYSQALERNPVSLQDNFWYSITVRNKDTTAPSNTVVVTDVLPAGFSFVRIDPTSQLVLTPTQTVGTDGRVRLNWTIGAIAANDIKTIKFVAQSGKSVGLYENLVIAAAPNEYSRCSGACQVRSYNGASNTYALSAVTVQPMITIEPALSPDSCALPGDVVNYKLTILNTNSHAYPDTAVSIDVPLGLTYVNAVAPSIAPNIILNPDGTTSLRWSNVRVPAKPNNAFGSQIVLEVQLKVGNIWGSLGTVVSSTSSYGLIPRKDEANTADPTVKVCPQQPSLAKISNRSVTNVGDEVIYQISVANPNNTAVTATVQDVLPTNIQFMGMLTGAAPSQSGNTLTWNVTIPAATPQSAGIVVLKFKTRVNSGQILQKYTNTATITQSSVAISTNVSGTSINTATFTIGTPVYLPIIGR